MHFDESTFTEDGRHRQVSKLQCIVNFMHTVSAQLHCLSDIPPLTFVDDTIGVSLCGMDSTAHLNSQTHIKKLLFKI